MALWEFPFKWLCFSLAAFRILTFCHFNYVLLWVSLSSYLLGDSVLPISGYPFPSSVSGIFQPQFNQITFSVHFSLSSEMPIMWILVYLVFSHRSLNLFSFFFFLLFWLGDFPYSNFQITYVFSCITLVCCSFLQVCFSFVIVFFSSDWFFFTFLLPY